MGDSKEITKGIIIAVIADSIIISASFLINYFGLINFISVQIPIWFFVILLLIIIPVILAGSRFRKHPEMSVSLIRGRPRHIIGEFTSKMFGVDWRVLLGRSTTFSEPYAFCESKPRCPICDYEMDFEKKGLLRRYYDWFCVRCNKYYRIPQKSPYEASYIVEKCLESDIRTGRTKVNDD